MQKITIIQEPSKDKPFCVVSKPQGLPSAPLLPTDYENCLSQVVELFPDLKSVSGRKAVEFGLLHRLDTETEGLLVVAASQEFYDFMQNEQKNGRFEKTYEAEVENLPENTQILTGFPPSLKLQPGSEITAVSYFRNFGAGMKAVRPVTEECGMAALKKVNAKKIYSTKISLNSDLHAICRITEGYRHQVRSHLAWCNYPIKGDRLYNASFNEGEKLLFRATSIRFQNPVTGYEELYTL